MQKFLLNKREVQLLMLENQARFILAVVNGEIIVSNRKKADLIDELQRKGFTPLGKKTKSVEPEVAGAIDGPPEETEENSHAVISDYQYLLDMAIDNLTVDRVQKLCADRDKLNKSVEDLRKETPKSFWMKDLDALERQLDV